MIPPKIVNPNAKQTQNFAIGVQCVFIKISGATSSHRPRAAEELRLAAGRLLVALGRVGTCYFAPNICSLLPSWPAWAGAPGCEPAQPFARAWIDA
jgi:hypothetical protein